MISALKNVDDLVLFGHVVEHRGFAAAARALGIPKSRLSRRIAQLEEQLVEKRVTLDLTDAARAFLADRGYDPKFGARPLARVIQDEIKRPLSVEILFGALESGGHVQVDLEDDGEEQKLVFRSEALDSEEPPRSPPEPAKDEPLVH